MSQLVVITGPIGSGTSTIAAGSASASKPKGAVHLAATEAHLRGGRACRTSAGDHTPSGAPPDTREWTKRYWSARQGIHLHVRQQGRLNQRYALLFRDYLRADSAAAGAYGEVKRALAHAVPDDWDIYYAVKDPACDLIMAAAEHWAARVGWTPQATEA